MPVSGRLRTGLLALLLARANRPVSAESLLGAFWDEDGPAHRQRLQTNVHKLRRALGEPERLVFEAGSYRLLVEPGELDADRFEAGAAAAAGTTDPRRRAELLREALGLWRGRPFHGLDLPGLVEPAQRLGESRRTAQEQLYGAEIECGRHEEVLGELVDLAGRHPLRERVQALLMTALHRAGRQADALAVYRDTRRALVDELGLDPGPELQAAEYAVLAGSESTVPVSSTASPTDGRAPEPVPPAELPASAGDIVGRRAELHDLDTLRAAGTPTPVLVTGTAGVGKSALVVHWGRTSARHFPDGQLYVDLQGFSPQDPLPATVALGRFLRSLGDDPATLPEDLSERAGRFRTRCAGRRLLVVLDNAATAEQVRPLLPGSASCLVVVTSRNRLDGLVARDGARRLELGRLSDADARALVAAHVDTGTLGPEQVGELVGRCAGLPLALRVAAARLAESGDPGPLLDALAGADGPLDALDTADDHSSVRSVLSWSYRRLPAEAARLYRLCGNRCEHAEHHIDVEGAVALLGTPDSRAARRLLDELVRSGVLEEVRTGRYRMHELLRAHAVEVATGSPEDTTGLLRLLAQYLQTATAASSFLQPRETPLLSADLPEMRAERPADRATALRWLDTHRGNLMCSAEFAAAHQRPELVVDISTTVWPYLDRDGHLDEARHLHTLARDAARTLGHEPAEGIALRALGLLELGAERDQEAVTLLQTALGLHPAGSRHPDGQALHTTTKLCLAAAHVPLGRVGDALRLAREAEPELARTPAAAAALRHLTRLLHRHGHADEARHYRRLTPAPAVAAVGPS
ncbi:AfsR/SARP family transcriptional regulator [Pseudonocardia ammonioxydans]|uniref:AfsR/SARP family transcriptional regulator n=1 Tax=Pseudonocardia ammonioxydans TaxID=260086 RepID=UPI0015A64EC3|nr:BTAD domain-containing putative transcriptional regulator [Pseudonocardia ammonioxydans]